MYYIQEQAVNRVMTAGLDHQDLQVREDHVDQSDPAVNRARQEHQDCPVWPDRVAIRVNGANRDRADQQDQLVTTLRFQTPTLCCITLLLTS